MTRVIIAHATSRSTGRSVTGISSDSVPFVRGDANASGRIDISDRIHILSYLFLGGAAPPCLDAADTDDNGRLELTDGLRVNVFLLLGGGPIPLAAACAPDPTSDALGVRRFSSLPLGLLEELPGDRGASRLKKALDASPASEQAQVEDAYL